MADDDGDDDKPLTLVEAFRILLRVLRPGSLADEIDSYQGLHSTASQPRLLRQPDDGTVARWELRFAERDPDDRDAALAVVTLMKEAIGDYRLPMEARHGGKGPRRPVHRADQRLGEVNIFESPELRFYKPGGRVDEDLSFYDCTVRQGDVIALRDAQQPPAPEADAVPSPSAPEAQSEAPPLPEPNLGGRPTDRDILLEEAAWRLRHESHPPSLRAFARDVLRPWLNVHGEHRGLKTGEVLKVETIEGHVRDLWNRR